MEVLELGCGWGSFSLWAAEHYPNCRILGVSNSAPQREFILRRAKRQGLGNLEVVTADANVFDTERRFDRLVSVEMFEHMRNYKTLLARIASWLKPGGKLFVHIFTHREYAYFFETEGEDDWMGKYFFTGGIMPSDDLPYMFQDHLAVDGHWRVNGRHYSRTLEAWLETMDANRRELMPLFRDTYAGEADRWFGRWRMFFMACSELFRYGGGNEWFVVHTLLRPGTVSGG
jgi:cyclopropane-fatty-acyl-phospholipid synthase